jgi:molybdopterin converting factor small subunit
MQSATGNGSVVEVKGNTVGECLDNLVKQFPDAKKHFFSSKGILFENISIYVNGESTYPKQLAKPVKDGDELNILVLIGGG